MNKSITESNRFNLSVHRGETDVIDDKSIKDYILRNKVDILILRVDSKSKAEQHKLSSLGFPVLHCDTIVHYYYDLRKHKHQELRKDLIFKVAEEKDLPLLSELISLIFNDYKNHYFNNPFLDNSKLVEGYHEWIKTHVSHHTESILWIVYKNNRPIGFAACSYDKVRNNSFGELYGVIPNSGMGLYQNLAAFTNNYFKDLNFKRAIASTQVNNFTSQKLWASLGSKVFKSYDTYHINSFLSDINLKFKLNIIFTESSHVDSLLYLSNERKNQRNNDKKIFNDNSIKLLNIKFDQLVYHILTEKWSSNNILLLSNRVLYLKSIYSQQEYSISVRSIMENDEGINELVIKLTDREDNILCIAYTKVKLNDSI